MKHLISHHATLSIKICLFLLFSIVTGFACHSVEAQTNPLAPAQFESTIPLNVEHDNEAYRYVEAVSQANSRAASSFTVAKLHADRLDYNYFAALTSTKTFSWFSDIDPNLIPNSITRYPGTNPSASDIKNMLIAAGQKYQIPPHILFGIAYQESGWREYGSDGQTLVSSDGGIGIMQLTGATAAPFGVNRLASDIAWNIDCGAKVLADKWNSTPIIGDNDRAKLENWYYAIWAYNGFVSGSAYPGKILNWIANCPNGQWESVTLTPPTPSQIASMSRITNTPTPIHVDANYDGIIDGTNTAPPTISFNETNINKWAGPNDINTRIITFSLQDKGGGIGGLSQNWDSDPGGNSPQIPGSQGGYLAMGYLPDSTRQGKHTAFVRAWNGNNTQSVVASSGWYGYDAAPPTVTITSAQTQGSTYNSPQTITWHIDDPDSGIKSWAQGWDSDPGDSTYATTDGNLDVPIGTHTLHIHAVDNVGNDKDWTFGPYTYTTQTQVGQKSDSSIDQRFVDCYNRVGASVIGSVLNNNFVHTAVGNGSGDGLAQDFVDGDGAKDIIIAKDGAVKAYDVSGNTWIWYSAQNFASGPIGFPNGDLQQLSTSGTAFDTIGTAQTFEGGWVYDSKYGTYKIPQAILSGLPLPMLIRIINGTFGFPTSNEQAAPNSPQGTIGTAVNFENGAIYHTTKYGIHGVYAAIYQQYVAAGSSGGKYGFPTSDPYSYVGGTRQDFEAGSLTSGVNISTHLLWNNTSGQASVWNMADANPAATCLVYGPYAGWKAVALAEGPDGHVRLIWDNADGRVSVWNLSDANPAATCMIYGPYGGWTGAGLTVGPNNTVHLFWNCTDGRVSVWNLSDAHPDATCLVYGPYAGWKASALAAGPDGHPRLLWTSTSGQGSVWNLSDASPSATCLIYGPYAGWKAAHLAVGSDNAVHLLWDNTDGRVSVWNLNDSSPSATCLVYGPYAGWTGMGLSVGADNAVHLLWDNASGPVSLWNLSDPDPSATCLVYGPYGGWAGVGLSSAL